MRSASPLWRLLIVAGPLALSACHEPLAPAAPDSHGVTAVVAPGTSVPRDATDAWRSARDLYGVPMTATRRTAAALGVEDQVPLLGLVSGESRHGEIGFRAIARPRLHRLKPRYDPYVAGGWMMQVLIDTDQRPTGYWLGYDFIVRGGELTGGTCVTRRITLEEQYPGGWGPQSGTAALGLHGKSFRLAVPLEALDLDDGAVDFVIETYATVPCPECPGGVGQAFAEQYFGRVSPRDRDEDGGPREGPDRIVAAKPALSGR